MLWNKRPVEINVQGDMLDITVDVIKPIVTACNKYLNKGEVKLVSRENAPKPYPNIFIEKDMFLDTIKLSHHDRMTVFFVKDV